MKLRNKECSVCEEEYIILQNNMGSHATAVTDAAFSLRNLGSFHM
jgi:hypothetical protein